MLTDATESVPPLSKGQQNNPWQPHNSSSLPLRATRPGAYQARLLLSATTLRQYFAAPEQFRHGIPANCIRLPRRNDCGDLLSRQPSRAEVRIQFENDLFSSHIVRCFLRRVPPISPA